MLDKAAGVLRGVQGTAPPAMCADLASRLASAHIDLGREMLVNNNASGAVPLLLAAVGVTSAVKAAPEVWAAFDGRLHYKALRCLAIAHLKACNYDLALTCARTLAADADAEVQPQGPVATAAAGAAQTAPFLAITALCGSSRLDEAEERLMSVCSDAVALGSMPTLVDLILDSIGHIVKGGRPQAAAAAVMAILRAAPHRSDAAVRFLDMTLGDSGQQSIALSDVARQAATTLLQEPECVAALKTAAEGDPAGGAARQTLAHCLAVVWNAATGLFERKQYSAALELFTAVMSYQLREDSNRPKAARAACLCHLALRQPAEALRYIRLADELESSGSPSVQTKFLMLKVHLERSGDDEDALAALGAFTSCADFDSDFFLLAALEAQSAQALRCAQQAYTLLYSTYSGCDAESAQPGHMAHLLRHLIKVTQAKWDAADAASVANKATFERGRADELAQQLLVSTERLSALGAVAFAGIDPSTASKELAWFGMTAWNAGLATTALQEGAVPAWLAAHQLFGAAGAFMDAQSQMDPTGDHAPGVSPHTRQLAWLLSAASALEVHKGTAERSAQLLGEAASALQRAAAVECVSGDATRAAVFMLLTGFGVKAASGDTNGCLNLLRSAEALPGLTSDTALKLAKMAAEDAGPVVALRAFELCLRVMQRIDAARQSSASLGLPPNYTDLAYVLRSTLVYAEQVGGSAAGGADSRDARLLRGFREASSLLASVPAGAYPPQEAEWLMTQAWNRGALLIKLGRPEPGEALLKVGLDLQRHAAKHSPQAEARKAEMLAALAALSRTRGPPATDDMVA